MELLKILTPEFIHSDARGKLVQLAHANISQINILTSHQGVRRGGHYHRNTHESFYIISGSVEISLSTHSGEHFTKQTFSDGDFIMIPPYCVHSLLFLDECVMLAFYDCPIVDKEGHKDIFPVEDYTDERNQKR